METHCRTILDFIMRLFPSFNGGYKSGTVSMLQQRETNQSCLFILHGRIFRFSDYRLKLVKHTECKDVILYLAPVVVSKVRMDYGADLNIEVGREQVA